MINTTLDALVFNCSDLDLQSHVPRAIKAAADAIVETYDATPDAVVNANARTNVRLIFSKIAQTHTLQADPAEFDKGYVELTWRVYNSEVISLGAQEFSDVMFAPNDDFRKSFASDIRRGLGLVLLSLHSSGAITLPFGFSWPYSLETRNAIRSEINTFVPELLQFIRSVVAEGKTPDAKRKTSAQIREWRNLYIFGTKLLLATGWLKPEDANYSDLLTIKRIWEEEWDYHSTRPPFRLVIDRLRAHFGDRCKVDAAGWRAALQGERTKAVANEVSAKHVAMASSWNEAETIRAILEHAVSAYAPDRLKYLGTLANGQPASELSSCWSAVQTAYLEKLRAESYKSIRQSISRLNAYLFGYLPAWFTAHPDCKIPFPATPSLFRPGVFVSRLLPVDGDVPPSLMDFLRGVAKAKQWSNDAFYASLKHLERLFEFIEFYSDELPGCAGFRQAISAHDYPAVARRLSTTKRPIPRRLFPLFIQYVEAIAAVVCTAAERVISGEVNDEAARAIAYAQTVIDADDFAAVFGFCPLVYVEGTPTRLRDVPNCLDVRVHRIRGGQETQLPSPHAVHQILAALYTGIRHQHIQWLDCDGFDSLCDADIATEFCKLGVNTDKTRSSAWVAHVNRRVIEVLRRQRAWRQCIDNPAFDAPVYYNVNEKSKWGKFRPLFSFLADGRPHTDQLYAENWKRLLAGIWRLTQQLGITGLPELYRLLPPGIAYDQVNLEAELKRYGENCQHVCLVDLKTTITPHSARASVVSQLITVLPAEFIGKYVTGQKEAVVHYYVRLDDEDLAANQLVQAQALMSATHASLARDGLDPRFVRAHDVNSRLATSMRANLEETLHSYGCVSIVLNEHAKSGIDVLRDTAAGNVAANATELCPYSNVCPPDVVRDLRGFHRCGLCQYAVRSIDHLPAIAAKIRESIDRLGDIERRCMNLNEQYSPDELDLLEGERQRIAEELTGWVLIEETLEARRREIAAGADDRKWIVPRPEVIEQRLAQVVAPDDVTKFVLARLPEAVAYPSLESPQLRAKFEVIRRQLLARTGNVREALASDAVDDPARVVMGMIRTLVGATGLSHDQLIAMLEGDINTVLPLNRQNLLLS